MNTSDPYCVICGIVNDLHSNLYCRKMQEQRRVYISIINHYKLALEDIAEGVGCRECGGEAQAYLAKKALGKLEDAE